MSLGLRPLIAIATITRDTNILNKIVPKSYRNGEPSSEQFSLCLGEVFLIQNSVHTPSSLVQAHGSGDGGRPLALHHNLLTMHGVDPVDHAKVDEPISL